MKNYLIILMITLNVFSLFGLNDNSNYLDSTDEKYRITKEVYDNIIRAIGDGIREIPVLKIFKDFQKVECPKTLGAWIWPCNGKTTIHFDKKLYDMCESLGSEWDNSLAYILCHELAHYYKGHLDDYFAGLVTLQGKARVLSENANEKRNLPKDTVVYLEKEADEYAAFFAYTADFDCRNILGSLIDSIYDWLYDTEKLTDSMFVESGYLSRIDRKNVANNAANTLRKLIPIFDAGNYLFIIKKYEQAAICFEYIAQIFPSREIYNNLGVCYAELGIASLEPNDIRRKFVFPFSFDRETLIGERLGIKEILNYFTKAEKAFNDAIRKDSLYHTAKVNLACVKVLQNDLTEAKRMIDSIIDVNFTRHPDDELLGSSFLIRGIVKYIEKDTGEAKTDFLKAQIFGNPFAKYNFEICNNTFSSITSLKDTLNLHAEEVCSNTAYSPQWINADKDKTIKYFYPHPNKRLKVNIITKFPSCTGFYIEYKTNPNNSKYDDVYNFLVTTPEYKDTTSLGIKIDDSSEKVKQQYGEPNYILSSIQGNIYIYEREFEKLKSGIIFKFNKQNKLTGWIVYCK